MKPFLVPQIIICSLLMLPTSHAQMFKADPAGAKMIWPPKQESLIKGGIFILSDTSVKHPNNGLTIETIPNDSLYQRDLNVRAYQLDAILSNQWPNISAWAKEDFDITFKSKESNLTLPLRDVWNKGGLIAVGDAKYQNGDTWPRIISKKDKKLTVLTNKDIGFYLVWPKEDVKLPSLWGIEMILVTPK